MPFVVSEDFWWFENYYLCSLTVRPPLSLLRSHCQTHCQSWSCRSTEPIRQPVDSEPATPHQLLTHPDH